MEITELNDAMWLIRRLQPIAKSLHRLDELACNQELTSRQENKVQKLVNEANEAAANLRLKVYHQSDPRGCSLYVIDYSMDNTNYTNGVAIY